MCTSLTDGDRSFLEPFARGSRLLSKPNDEATGSRDEDTSMRNASNKGDAQKEVQDIDPSYGFDEFLASMDILICGRGLYEQTMQRTNGKWPYTGKRLIVFSAVPLSEPVSSPDGQPPQRPFTPPPNSEHFTGTPAQLMQKLFRDNTRSRKFRRESVWVMGGASIRGALLQLGAIERIELVVVPKIITRGNPFAPRSGSVGVPLWAFPSIEGGQEEERADVDLQLIECRSYENGVLGLSYVVGGMSYVVGGNP